VRAPNLRQVAASQQAESELGEPKKEAEPPSPSKKVACQEPSTVLQQIEQEQKPLPQQEHAKVKIQVWFSKVCKLKLKLTFHSGLLKGLIE
jgi:hypothetical protein